MRDVAHAWERRTESSTASNPRKESKGIVGSSAAKRTAYIYLATRSAGVASKTNESRR